MSTGAAYWLPPARPLCTETIFTPVSRTRSRNARPTWGTRGSWSSRNHGDGACVYTFHAAIGYSSNERVHRVELRVEVAERGKRLAVQEDPPVAAEEVGGAAGVVHPRGRERTVVVGRGDRAHHREPRVGAQEHLLEVVIEREAGARVGVAARRLREPAAEVAARRRQVVLEEVGLEIEDELVAAERVGRRTRVDGRLLGKVQRSAGLAAGPGGVLLARAPVERDEDGGGGHRGAQEVTP